MKGVARTPQSLGEVAKMIRLKNGLSQDSLAAQLGVSQRYVSELERGMPKILDQRYFDLLHRLGITITYETSD